MSWLPGGLRVELVTIDSTWRLCAVRGGRLVDGTKLQVLDLQLCDPRCPVSVRVAFLRLASTCWAQEIERVKAEVRAKLDAMQAAAEEREAASYDDPARQVSILRRDDER